MQAPEDLFLSTPGGKIRCRVHRPAKGGGGIVWVFGAGGGLGGPAGGLYERLAAQLQPEGVFSLQVAYRQPGHMDPCIEDTLTGVSYLESIGVRRAVLVGHSFGGAVVINAGARSSTVIAVAALSSQSYGAGAVSQLSPKPLLLIHGEDDEVLPPSCSETLYRAARRPKQLLLYPGCLHGLDQCRDEIDRDLLAWLHDVLQGT
jgi:fermentation-respiration switch protein FrsA (DUF1100 family)